MELSLSEIGTTPTHDSETQYGMVDGKTHIRTHTIYDYDLTFL